MNAKELLFNAAEARSAFKRAFDYLAQAKTALLLSCNLGLSLAQVLNPSLYHCCRCQCRRASSGTTADAFASCREQFDTAKRNWISIFFIVIVIVSFLLFAISFQSTSFLIFFFPHLASTSYPLYSTSRKKVQRKEKSKHFSVSEFSILCRKQLHTCALALNLPSYFEFFFHMHPLAIILMSSCCGCLGPG